MFSNSTFSSCLFTCFCILALFVFIFAQVLSFNFLLFYFNLVCQFVCIFVLSRFLSVFCIRARYCLWFMQLRFMQLNLEPRSVFFSISVFICIRARYCLWFMQLRFMQLNFEPRLAFFSMSVFICIRARYFHGSCISGSCIFDSCNLVSRYVQL